MPPELITAAAPGTHKLPPASPEAELSVLGSLLIDTEAISRVADVITSTDFYRKNHQLIYKAILALFEKGEPVDVLSVGSRLGESGELENVGGTSYLTTLVNAVPTSTHIVHYA